MKWKLTRSALIISFLLLGLNVHSQPPPGSGWTNVFADEFGGNSINNNIWTVKNPDILGKEPTFLRSQVVVNGGTLKINNDYPNGGVPKGGWIQSKAEFAKPGRPKYGYYEARLRINGTANGKVWPSWWIWGNRKNGVITTEFDLMEYSGSSTQFFNNRATTSHHSIGKEKIFPASFNPSILRSDTTTPANNAAQRNAFQWHVWGMHWTPNEVSFYYDGVKYFSTTDVGAQDAAKENAGLRLILSSSPHTFNVFGNNNGPGGFQGNNPQGAGAAAKPGDNLADLEVDWVRVWTGGTIGNTNNGGGNGPDTNVTFKGQSNNKFISSENGAAPITATRNAVGAWERFTVNAAGNGKVTIQGNNGNYISSENGNSPMTCSRTAIGDWEKFTLVSQGGNVYALRGNNNKYVSHENGNGPMTCNRNAVGAWEKFVIAGLNNNKEATIDKPISENAISFYPNPSTPGNLGLEIRAAKNIRFATLEITDVTGKVVVKKSLGNLEAGRSTISLNNEEGLLRSGLYITKVTLDGDASMAKIMIK